MRKAKRILPVLGIGLVITVTVLFAGLDGIWGGWGDDTSVTWGGITFYPWDNWKGDITSSSDLNGEWIDGTYKGTFSGVKTDSNYHYTQFGFTGTWTLYYNNNYITMGPFYMRFDTVYNNCSGEWTCDSTSDNGCMEGRKH